MTATVSISRAIDIESPDDDSFRRWVNAALELADVTIPITPEVSLRLNDYSEMAVLNQQFRGKTGPTNVLSFPAELPEGSPLQLLGDIAICAPLVFDEARAQGKLANNHWAHLTVHGVLHLLGFDHIEEQDAIIMEQREVVILTSLGFANPYQPSN